MKSKNPSRRQEQILAYIRTHVLEHGHPPTIRELCTAVDLSSSSTVHSHRTNLMKKLNLSSRHELIQYARQRGLMRDT
ncbi:MAG: hypothetical protein HY784_19145 [Chloroflexi bacterium]|nr:hypothetical protein [Chloroflexota bacterium]